MFSMLWVLIVNLFQETIIPWKGVECKLAEIYLRNYEYYSKDGVRFIKDDYDAVTFEIEILLFSQSYFNILMNYQSNHMINLLKSSFCILKPNNKGKSK